MQLTTIATIVGLAAAVVAAPSSQSAKNMASSDPSSPPDWLLQAKQEKSWSLCCVSGSSPPYECEYSADPDAKCSDSLYPISWTCHWKASFDDSSYDDLEGKIRCQQNDDLSSKGDAASGIAALSGVGETLIDEVVDLVKSL